MATPSLSIVIPTHKRADILRTCLEHIEKQTIARNLEVIVVSDGHDDKTTELMNHILQTENGPNASLARMEFLEIPKSQQGIARNRGVEKVTAPIVLFIGEDILLDPSACQRHIEAHKRLAASDEPVSGELIATRYPLPALVLGFTTWDLAVGITPVMTWLEKTGWQFGYPMISQYAHSTVPSDIQHRFTYTSHISLPTDIAKKFPFREDVSLYGWEDILWGTELRDAGVPLYYEPDARALHHHHIELADSLKRMETLGQSIKKMEIIDPTFDRIPRGITFLKHQIASWLPGFRGSHERAFLRGLGR